MSFSVDLYIDVAIIRYSTRTRIVGFLCVVLTPVLRYDTSTVLEYTVLYGTCICTRTSIRRITVRYEYSTAVQVQARAQGPEYRTVRYRYRSLVNVHKSTVLVGKAVRYAALRVPP